MFFLHFSPISRKCALSGRQVAAGAVSHSSSWTPTAYEPEESLLEAELEEGDPDCLRDEFGRLWVQLASFPGRWYSTGPGRDGDIWWDELGWGSLVPGHGVRLLLPGCSR